ncbi:MAG: hypothetical protein AB1461_11790 [Thermodesulfobacteriota bacterium]
MKTWRNIFSPLLALLLIVQMSTAFAAPPGAHLALCFGFDGHFDVAQDFCDTSVTLPQQQQDDLSAGLHHGDCLDLVIGCGSYDQAVPHSASLCKTKVRQESARPAACPAATFSRNLPQLEFQPPSRLHHQELPTSSLLSLRTVVLLI